MIDRHNDIPGATPLGDVSGLKLKGITTRAQLCEAEFRNTLKPIEKYLAAKPTRRMARFDLKWALALHREMFGEVWTWAGKTRRSNTNIGVDWHHVEVSLQNLLDDLAAWNDSKMDMAEQSAKLHHRAVQIHPFDNGNGRWARLLANIWLKREGHPIVRWPEDGIADGVSSTRGEYLQAIREADNGDCEPLIEMHRRYMKTEKRKG